MKNVMNLTGAELDFWVAKAEGLEVALEVHPMTVPKPIACWLRDGVSGRPDHSRGPYRPSTDWAIGGQIIDRVRIAIAPANEWLAFCAVPGVDGGKHWHGPTALAAAMRAYVASKFGEEVG